MSAVDRARQALAAYWHMPGAHADALAPALRDLLAEIDAHWVDARELVALAGDECAWLDYQAYPRAGGKPAWMVSGTGRGLAVQKFGATAAEAIRAAREATR